MMKIIAVILAFNAIIYHDFVDANTYTSKFDDVNLDEILHSERLLENYVKCLKDEGPCSPDSAELKRVMPDAIATDCQKCTEKQREGSDKVIKYLSENKPEVWEELEAIYDPNGFYKEKYNITDTHTNTEE